MPPAMSCSSEHAPSEAELAQDAIDLVGKRALCKQSAGLPFACDHEAIAHEAASRCRRAREPAQLLAERHRAGDRAVVGPGAPMTSSKRMTWAGLKKCRADDGFRSPGRTGDLVHI